MCNKNAPYCFHSQKNVFIVSCKKKKTHPPCASVWSDIRPQSAKKKKNCSVFAGLCTSASSSSLLHSYCQRCRQSLSWGGLFSRGPELSIIVYEHKINFKAPKSNARSNIQEIMLSCEVNYYISYLASNKGRYYKKKTLTIVRPVLRGGWGGCVFFSM